MRGPSQWVTLWQTQPAGSAERWAQALGEVLAPGLGGPMLPADQPEVELILTSGSVRLSRDEARRLTEALVGWLDRTAWTAQLPPAPDPDPLPGGECPRCEHTWHDGMCLALVPETAGNVRGLCTCAGSR